MIQQVILGVALLVAFGLMLMKIASPITKHPHSDSRTPSGQDTYQYRL